MVLLYIVLKNGYIAGQLNVYMVANIHLPVLEHKECFGCKSI